MIFLKKTDIEPLCRCGTLLNRFGPVLANDRVWLDIYKGEIGSEGRGKNGSGKDNAHEYALGIYFFR